MRLVKLWRIDTGTGPTFVEPEDAPKWEANGYTREEPKGGMVSTPEAKPGMDFDLAAARRDLRTVSKKALVEAVREVGAKVPPQASKADLLAILERKTG